MRAPAGGSDHLERSRYHDEACERHSENEVALYVHAHDAWDELITERRASQRVLTYAGELTHPVTAS